MSSPIAPDKPVARFPEELTLHRPERGRELLAAFYERHHAGKSLSFDGSKDEAEKVGYFREQILRLTPEHRQLGIDLGCRGGVIAAALSDLIPMVGVDVDRNAIARANERGVPCIDMDIGIALDFRDKAFDLVLLTEVLEHLPYPAITVQEVHRILRRQDGGGLFLGSVPIEYSRARRWKVFRGRRLSNDPTHIHHFTLGELTSLLENFFEQVELVPLVRSRGQGRSVNHTLSPSSVTDNVVWCAARPRPDAQPWSPPAGDRY